MTTTRGFAVTPVNLAIADTNLMAGRLLSDHFEPVSYTHLDVYKRQVSNDTARALVAD